jgi:hypothetical protein
MGTLEWVGTALAVLLGVVYLFLGVGGLPDAFGIAFCLAGLGYLGATALALVDYRRRLVYGVGIIYNVLLFVLYFLLNGIDVSELVGLSGVVKLAQVVFVALLVILIDRSP